MKKTIEELREEHDAATEEQLIKAFTSKAEAWCSAAERCRSEVAAKLEKWLVDPATAQKVLEHLEKEGYVDEVRYASAFVHDKLKFDHWGRLKIAAALKQKRVAPAAVSKALDGIDEDEYAEVLKAVIKSKARTIKGASEYERRMKLLRSVASRGFEPALASALLDIPEEDF